MATGTGPRVTFLCGLSLHKPLSHQSARGIVKPRPQRRSFRDAALFSLMIVGILAAAFGAAEVRLLLTRSPNIVLANPGISVMDGFPPPGLYLQFTLRNSGDGGGYAHVGLFVNESLSWSQTYRVKAGTSLLVAEVVGVECPEKCRGIDWWNGSNVRLLWTSHTFFFVDLYAISPD